MEELFGKLNRIGVNDIVDNQRRNVCKKSS